MNGPNTASKTIGANIDATESYKGKDQENGYSWDDVVITERLYTNSMSGQIEPTVRRKSRSGY